ncbi:MAG: SH3 domain-containing protein, partial [Chloroflexota bacterium]
ATPTPVTPTATVAPVIGQATARLNVRAAPATSAEALGMLEAFVEVQINGKDASGAWYRIDYPDGPDGLGWVAAQYVLVTGIVDVPVIQTGDGDSGPSGTLTEAINVRAGPGTSFESLGLLSAGAVVSLTGKNDDATWLQIDYPGGPGGKGWVSAAFVETESLDELPIVSEEGAVIGTGTATGIPATPTATVVPAPTDSDSLDAPSTSITLSPSSNTSFSYTGDVSTPQGDEEDWIGFSVESGAPANLKLYASLSCTGTGRIDVKLWLAGQPTAVQDVLACGETDKLITYTPATAHTLQLIAAGAGSGVLHYVGYTLKISLTP